MNRAPRLAVLALVVSIASAAAPRAARQVQPEGAASGLPLIFVECEDGQGFEARQHGLRLALDEAGMGFVLTGADAQAYSLRVDFEDGQATPRGVDRHRARVHVLRGAREQWRTDVPTWSRVRYASLREGVDLEVYERDGHLEYDLFLAPGAADAVRFRCSGAAPTVDGAGALVLATPAGELRFAAPRAWQVDEEGAEHPVRSRFRTLGSTGFEIVAEGRDPRLFTVIDPIVVYATYLGGSSADEASAASLESDGTSYVTGWTSSGDFPVTPGSLATSRAGEDGFVARLTPEGELVWATFFGGSKSDRGLDVAVHEDNGVVVVGRTQSNDFPVTPGAFQGTKAGRTEGFCLKLSRDGDALQFATYLGGTEDDEVTSVALDRNGVPYVTGWTKSDDFPKNVTSIQTGRAGKRDAFVAKVAPDGSGLLYSTFLGGAGSDEGLALAVDETGAVYVGGATSSADFPTTAAAFDTTRSARDGFLAKLTPMGTALDFATFLGGADDDEVQGLAVDRDHAIVVVGTTRSRDFPVTGKSQQTGAMGGRDGFATKFVATGAALAWSRHLGGGGQDQALGVAVDAWRSPWIVGSTTSSDLPVTADAPQAQRAGGEDAFVIALDEFGGTTFATYLGGPGDDRANDVAIEPFLRLSLVVGSAKAGMPVQAGLAPSGNAGRRDAFVTRIGHGVCGEPARFHTLGRGCGAMLTGMAPRLGLEGSVFVSGAPGLAEGFLMISPPGASPYSLAPGCDVYLDIPNAQLLASFVTDANGTFGVTLPVQNDPSQCGLSLVVQGAVVGTAGPLAFGALTDAALVFIGD